MRRSSFTELFFVFAKIGAMTFGGGYAMLPLIQAEVVDRKKWMTETQLMDFFAISQATPGVIAVNIASLVGYRYHGVLGAIAATLGVVTPSFIIICVIALFFNKFIENQLVAQVFAALRVCVCVLIINALIPFFKNGLINIFTSILFIISAAGFAFLNISPVWIIIVCALAAILQAKFKGGTK